MTVFLYHGPGARSRAVTESRNGSVPIAEPIGDGGMKVDDARNVVQLLSSFPVGKGRKSVVIGPMDDANDKACDCILKTVEEVDSSLFSLILWARDADMVRPTIRSRSVSVWCPGEQDLPDEVLAMAWEAANAVSAKDLQAIKRVVKSARDQLPSFLDGLARVASAQLEEDAAFSLRLWKAVRSEYPDAPTYLGVYTSLLHASLSGER